MKTDNILMMLFSVTLGAIGQVALKKGAISLAGHDTISFSHVLNSIKNIYILLGFLLYGISAISWLVVLSRTELSYAYPMISINYILIIFLSRFVFHEHLTINKLAGTLIICFGILVLSRHA